MTCTSLYDDHINHLLLRSLLVDEIDRSSVFFSEGIRLCFPYPNVCKIERIKYTECNIIISFSEKKNIIVSHSIWNLKGVIAYCHLVKLELRDGIWVWKCFGGIWWFDSTVCGFCCNSLQCTKLTSEFLR